ncbi:MAG: hypothetical protein CVV05_00250 [Gammaproteobacteria bacterium HGW-Gammaproteobacteria-1]|nr:MAG: hypothetical protein CVV05_00250 [Gammaproteobacteria bacterium HGW-Gammaproteobacteria-1]
MVGARLFQQGRATYSDGCDHWRVLAGIAATLLLFVVTMVSEAPFWLALVIVFGGSAATATWSVIAGQVAGQQCVAEGEAIWRSGSRP